MNFLQIRARVRLTNALIDTIVFTEMEIRGGIKKAMPYMPVVSMTAEGWARVFPRDTKTKFDFEVFFETAETVSKLAKIEVFLAQGYIFDLELLSGLQFYSQPFDALVRDPTESVVNYCELTAFDQDWRTIHAAGLEWRTPCKMTFSASIKPAVPTSLDWIGAAPPINGFGN